MSGLIIIRTEVYNSKMMKFLDKLSNWTIPIAKIYHYNKTTEIFFNLTLMGYAVPLEFYDDVKKYVKDVWHCCIGDSDVKVGKNTSNYKWESCKLNNCNK